MNGSAKLLIVLVCIASILGLCAAAQAVNWVQIGSTDTTVYTTPKTGLPFPSGTTNFSSVGTIPAALAPVSGVVPNFKVTYKVQAPSSGTGWGPQPGGNDGLALFVGATPSGSNGLFTGYNGNITSSYFMTGAIAGSSSAVAGGTFSDSLAADTYYDVTVTNVSGLVTTTLNATGRTATYTISFVNGNSWGTSFAAFRAQSTGGTYLGRYGAAQVTNITFYQDTDPQSPPDSGAVTGTVMVNGSTPAAGAIVQTADGSVSTTCNSAGVYQLGLPSGTYSLKASLANYYTQQIDNVVVISGASTSGVNFSLVEMPKITGQVTSSLGAPLAVAAVAVSGGQTTNTDSAGNYALHTNGTGTFTVQASMANYANNAQSVVVSGTDPIVVTRNFSLVENPVVSGHVRDTVGTAVAGATVTVTGGQTATTDSAGYYKLHVAAAATYTITATKATYSSDVQSVVVAGTPPIAVTQDFTINNAPTVAGYVRTLGGAAVSGATVAVTGGSSVTTDGTGHYLIYMTGTGTYTFTASKSKFYNDVKSVNVSGTPPIAVAQDFTLTEHPVITGHVRDSGSAPVAGATVTVTGGEVTTTDTTGYYLVHVDPAGTYTVTASKATYVNDVKSVNATGTPPIVITQDFTVDPKVISWVQTGTTVAGPITAMGNTTQGTNVAFYSAAQPFPIDLAVVGGVLLNSKVTYHLHVDGVPGWGAQTGGIGGLAMYLPATPDGTASPGSPGLYSGDLQTYSGGYVDRGAVALNSPTATWTDTGLFYANHPQDFDVTAVVIDGACQTTVTQTLAPTYITSAAYTTTSTDATAWTGKFNFAAFKAGRAFNSANWNYGQAAISNITFYRDSSQIPPPNGTITGTVTRNFGDHRAIAGATVVSTDGYAATTDSAGRYSLRVLAGGAVTLTASNLWYANKTITTPVVGSGSTVSGQDFALDLSIDAGAVAVDTIPQLKAVPVGTTVYLMTPALLVMDTDNMKDGSFQIQSNDRVAGMKCLSPVSPAPALPFTPAGTRIIFKGAMEADPNGGSPVVRLQSLVVNDAPGDPAPVGRGSKGITSSNTLVKVWGKVIAMVDNPNRGLIPAEQHTNPDKSVWDNWYYDHITINDGGQAINIPMYGVNRWFSMDFSPITTLGVGHYIYVIGVATTAADGSVVVIPRTLHDMGDYTAMGIL